jgi:Fe2+ or Zn2+ uptake regulation protein
VNDGVATAHDSVVSHTNLVCMSCGHIQPVQRDQLPSRCENCRGRFTVHGYLLDDTTDAAELSQEVLDNKAISRITGGRL